MIVSLFLHARKKQREERQLCWIGGMQDGGEREIKRQVEARQARLAKNDAQ
jgi:hypothetical protein